MRSCGGCSPPSATACATTRTASPRSGGVPGQRGARGRERLLRPEVGRADGGGAGGRDPVAAGVRRREEPPAVRAPARGDGTDLFVYHGYSTLFIGGRWTKASRAFNAELCARFGVPPLEFDGTHDALLHAFTGDGSATWSTCASAASTPTCRSRRSWPPSARRTPASTTRGRASRAARSTGPPPARPDQAARRAGAGVARAAPVRRLSPWRRSPRRSPRARRVGARSVGRGHPAPGRCQPEEPARQPEAERHEADDHDVLLEDLARRRQSHQVTAQSAATPARRPSRNVANPPRTLARTRRVPAQAVTRAPAGTATSIVTVPPCTDRT